MFLIIAKPVQTALLRIAQDVRVNIIISNAM